jgi:hypothetical protein
MPKLGRAVFCAVSIALCIAPNVNAADLSAALGFNSHGLPDKPVTNPYATKPRCVGKTQLAPARRYLDALRSDVAIVEAWRARTGRYPDGAFPLKRVGTLTPQYVRSPAGFGFILRFRPFSAIRPLFDCAYLSVATAAQLDQRGLPSRSPDGGAGSIFVFTPETGIYLVGEISR